MILELTAMVFPLLISVIVSFNITLEEKASHFQTLLAISDRNKMMLAKLVFLYGSGIFSLSALVLLFLIGISFWGMDDAVQLEMLIRAAVGIGFCNLIIYILHLSLSLKFGLGVSYFGVYLKVCNASYTAISNGKVS